jgi:hypothetical protein
MITQSGNYVVITVRTKRVIHTAKQMTTFNLHSQAESGFGRYFTTT